MRKLSPALSKIARENLNEIPERVEQDLNILRLWIKQQRYLGARDSDEQLIVFLRRCQYSLERTKEQIDKYYSSFTYFPEVMANRRVNHRILEINRLGIHYFPEYPKCDNQTALLISRPSAINYSRHCSRDVMRFYSMALEIIALENDNASVAGISLIVDMKGFNLKSINYTEGDLNRKMFYWSRECCPLRINHIYFLNISADYYVFLLMHKYMYSNRSIPITLLRSQNDLYRHFPKSSLPEEYGGTNGHIAECIRYMDEMLKHYRSYFEEEEHCGTIEELRCGTLDIFQEDFGKDGSYRQIESD